MSGVHTAGPVHRLSSVARGAAQPNPEGRKVERAERQRSVPCQRAARGERGRACCSTALGCWPLSTRVME